MARSLPYYPSVAPKIKRVSQNRKDLHMKWLKHIGLSLALIFLYATQSHACGGFFCSNVPMNQAAERILFVKRDNGKMTTHVQIQYSGEKTDFAWILPVPSVPELGVSHNGIFQQLQFATQHTFQLEWEESNCPNGEGYV